MPGDSQPRDLHLVTDIDRLLRNLAVDLLSFVIAGDLENQFHSWMVLNNLLPPGYTKRMLLEDLDTIHAAATRQPHPRVEYPNDN